MTSTELFNLLDRSAWFRAAPDALRAQLIELGRTRGLPAGQRLFNRGDADDGFYCVLDGLMRIG
ncbi:cyclic nucleotide-binding domain-containing protein, partial [Paraburkholderia hospita]